VSVSNTYTVAQKPPLSLTVTNSFGCYATLSKPQLLTVLRQLQASFTASQTQLCETDIPIQFTSTSTGEGVLSYEWDFGDGVTSNEAAPSHIYTNNGSFTAKLTVRNDAGCTAVANDLPLKVGNFKAEFAIPAALCINQATYFTNTSQKPYDSVKWLINDVSYAADIFGNLNYKFSATGDYSVKLICFYKGCTPSLTKQVSIGEKPVLKGFVVDNNGACSVPVTFTFTDTTAGVVKWQWRYLNNTTVFSDSISATKTYTEVGSNQIWLTVTNPFGCQATTVKTISFNQPKIEIFIKQSTSSQQSPNRGCPGLQVTFSTLPVNDLLTFSWDFGDGSPMSTNAEPVKMYSTPGSYQVKLTYETRKGCKGTITYDSIYINDIVASGFNASPDTLICGNSKVTFTPDVALANRDYIWQINGKEVAYNLSAEPFVYQFEQEGYYTISLTLRTGTCMNTISKANYIHVLPPFPKISNVLNTCFGNRGKVVFTDSTRSASNWVWNFGDGTNLGYNNFVKNLEHYYKASGKYTTTLTVTNGICTATDSVIVNVLLKQRPKLAANVPSACSADTALLYLSNYEKNPTADSASSYSISQIQFGDLSVSKATINTGNWVAGFTTSVKGLETDKLNLRIITLSNYFNCQDTSNFVPVKTNGLVPAFTINQIKCLRDNIVFKDTTQTSATAIITKWEWLIDATTKITAYNANPVSYRFKKPGTFFIRLRLTDSNGCTYLSPADSSKMVTVSGPLAAFDVSDTSVLINTTVNFTDRSSFLTNSSLLWRFPDNSVSTDKNPSFTFSQEGSFRVSLIAVNSATGCTDTARKIITVKRVKSIFTYQETYPGKSNCPPLLVNFKSSSINAVRLRWTFGDGGTSDNDVNVSHVYTRAGIFTVTLYSFDLLGKWDSSKQLIEVHGPYAILHTDTLAGCNILPVKFSADTINAVSFQWDFGDGTIANINVLNADHTFQFPGVYHPSLILTDRDGCVSSSELDSKIIVDQLSAGISATPNTVICDSSIVRFKGTVSSLARDQLSLPLQYYWTSSLHTGQSFTDTTAVWLFNQPGTHDVALRVASPYGCSVQQLYKVNIEKGIKATISSPAIICLYDSASFTGNVIPAAAGLAWQWDFNNGTISNEQQPKPVKYSSPGFKPVTLVVSNGHCSDTVHYSIEVRNKPIVSLTANKPFVCLGETGVLTASGGANVKWQPTVYSTSNNGFTAQISPTVKTVYTATVSDSAGCANAGSITIDVVNPFKLQVEKQLFICPGDGIKLNASGAFRYEWSGSNASGTGAVSPYFTPATNDVVKVIGYDAYNCFTDTAFVTIAIAALPTVNAGADLRAVAGQEIELLPVVSTDVVKWSWSPPKYLECSNCAITTCKPWNDISYKLTVTNEYGCSASDSLKVQMICGKDLVWIPTGFTPNNDNLNDRFVINGSGIFIKHLVIYDRWGKKVFEVSDVNTNDQNSSWNGMNNGMPAPVGAYVYILEVVCNSSKEMFSYKGNITLIR
jgi:gliding motility-associated-like protein